MFWRFFRKPKDTSEISGLLPDLQLDIGERHREWKRLSALSLKRSEFLGDDPYDVWTLTFEQHAFMMIFKPAEDGPGLQGPEQFAAERLVLALVRNPGDKEFKPDEGQIWSRQIEHLRGSLLPKLNDWLRTEKMEYGAILSN